MVSVEYDLICGLLYGIAVQINAGRVDISLKKEDPHKQWESIGTFLAGHGASTAKSRRGEKDINTFQYSPHSPKGNAFSIIMCNLV